MIVLDGKKLSKILATEIADQVTGFIDQGWRPPHLGAVLIGDNPASRAYVGNKIRLCDKVGFKSTLIQHPDDITEQELLDIIHGLNQKNDLDGYIVQLPLPRHIDETKVLLAIDPEKDVDGFHPLNIGKMTLGLPGFKPATPYGIMLMIEHYGIETTGKHVVVLGRSQIVGTPMSILLSRKGYPGDSTVTLAHSKTKNLREVLLQADIIIAAIGIPNFVKADMVKEGAIVIDVGINKVDDIEAAKGYRLVGDVDFDAVAEKVEAITPVPGGVGPMTVMALIVNTLSAYRKTMKLD